MEPDCSLPCSQEHNICSSSIQSTLHTISSKLLLILFFHLRLSLAISLFPSGSIIQVLIIYDNVWKQIIIIERMT
jgi:hypothetical protein